MIYLLTFGAALLVAAVLTPVARWLAFRHDIVAIPGGRRKHKGKMPILGGIPVFGAFAVGSMLIYWLSPPQGDDAHLIAGVLIGSLFVFAGGLFDDVRERRPWAQFLIQFVAAGIAFYFEVFLEVFTNPLTGQEVHIPKFFVFFVTLFWISGMMNTVNWLDGLDGLAAGVGTIGVIDDDVVENANLQRQVIHTDASIGMPKVFSAEAAMRAQNPYVDVRPYHRRLTDDLAKDLFAEYDVILDGTDNFATRYTANAAAVATGKPLVSGALSQWEGQLSVFDPANGAPCYRCIFPEAPADGLAPSCAEAGVIGPLPGVVGAMMAVEAIKIITKAGAPLRAEMLIYDALWGETRKIGLSRRPDCPDCGAVQST